MRVIHHHPPYRYGVIARERKQGWSDDHVEACRFIMRAAGLNSYEWKIGKTKLFLKEPNAVGLFIFDEVLCYSWLA